MWWFSAVDRGGLSRTATRAPPRGSFAAWASCFGLAGSASLGLTMMACYGGPTGSSVRAGSHPDANADTTGADGGAPD